jgi:hypothetical protein
MKKYFVPDIKCRICGVVFEDAGSHPLTCGKRDCAMEASRMGLFGDPPRKRTKLLQSFKVTKKGD